jgi:tRNA(Ile)-lysidine synthase
LTLAHLNHQIRGTESDADERFVRDLHTLLVAAGASHLRLACASIDVPQAAEGENLEAMARTLRYEWLTKVARASAASWIATGHTADDQAETVLHRLLRGTGIRGLAAIPRRRELGPGIVLLRPLLPVRRSDVLTFLQQIGQPFCTDRTNQDRHYTRARLRHELLPWLTEQFNPQLVPVLGRLAEQAEELRSWLEQQAAALLAEAELPRAGAMVIMDARKLAEAPTILAGEALRLIWQREGWPLGEMGLEDWRRVLEVARGEINAVDLPASLHARRVSQVLQLSPKQNPRKRNPA